MNRGIDFALFMFNYDATPVDTIKERFFCEPRVLASENNSTEYALIDEHKTPCFSVNRLDVKDRYTKDANTFYIGIVSRGTGTVTTDHETVQVYEGSRFFVPHQTGPVTFESQSGMEIITTFPPE